MPQIPDDGIGISGKSNPITANYHILCSCLTIGLGLISGDIGLALIVHFASNQGQQTSYQAIISGKSHHAHARWPPVM